MNAESTDPALIGFYSRHPTVRTALAVVSAATTLAGCMTFRPAPGPPQATIDRRPSAVRITTRTGQRIELNAPRLLNDSVVGFGPMSQGSARLAIAVSDVVSVAVEKTAVGRTALLAAAGLTLVLVLAANDRSSGGGSSSPPPSSGDGYSSCPTVYRWDGAAWRLASGTFGGSVARPLQRTVTDNLDGAVPQHGQLRLRVANELVETDYLDALAVLAVDHEPGLSVAADPAGGLHTLGALQPPAAATDFRGADALARVRAADGWSWESSLVARDTARAEDLRDGLLLSFARPQGARRAHLVVDASNTPWAVYLLDRFIAAHGAATDAWYDSINTRPAAAMAFAARLMGEGSLIASVRTGAGWTDAGAYQLVGPEMARRQVLDLDLSQVAGDTVAVRLASGPAFWLVDRVAMDFTADRPFTARELPLRSARDAAGRDVAPLLAAVDDRYYQMEPGDAAEAEVAVPSTPAGVSRTYLLRATGWYRVHVPSVGPADHAMIDAVMNAPMGIARTSVERINAALSRLADAGGAARAR